MFKYLNYTLVAFCAFLVFSGVDAQSKADDIPVADLPVEVKAVLETYTKILHESKSVDEAGVAFGAIAGGTLVNEAGKLTSNTLQFGLKKDFNNFKHYAYPVQITRVNKTISNGAGYGATKIAGTSYKIWIAKNDPAKGMPAPVTIIAPSSGAAKVVNVGSY